MLKRINLSHLPMAAAVPGHHKQVWFDKGTLSNIFAFADMEEHCRITCGSAKEKAFCVHMPKQDCQIQESSQWSLLLQT